MIATCINKLSTYKFLLLSALASMYNLLGVKTVKRRLE